MQAHHSYASTIWVRFKGFARTSVSGFGHPLVSRQYSCRDAGRQIPLGSVRISASPVLAARLFS